MDLELKGKVAIVGGASKGLGRARDAVGFVLGADVHHVRLAALVEMGKFFQLPSPSGQGALRWGPKSA